MEKVMVTPWSDGTRPDQTLPGNALFACAYEVDFGLTSVDEAAFVRQTEYTDELWVATRKGDGPLLELIKATPGKAPRAADLQGIHRAVAAPRESDMAAAVAGLLRHLFRSRVGFAWPARFIAPGVVAENAYRSLVDGLEAELDRNAEAAKARESAIVSASRTLGLHPEPTGTGPDHWKASCPETNHPLYMDAAKELFFCGWCRRRGGPEELRFFVEERRKARW
jgi:hypothetical protein